MNRSARASLGVWAVVVFILAGVAGVLTYAAVFESRAAAFYDPPSDDEMISRFRKHAEEYAALLEVYRGDPDLEADIQALEMNTLGWGLDSEDIRDARLKEYFELRERLGVDSITPGRYAGVELVISSRGGLGSGWHKAYLYSDLPPSPLVGEIPARPVEERGWRYRHVEGSWYLAYSWYY